MDKMNFESLRTQMVKRLVDKGIRDADLLSAIAAVPRERFVPVGILPMAYDDMPLPIWQTNYLVHPWIMAYELQALQIKKSDRVLELGTNSGYQTAVLSRLADKVVTVEPSLDMAMTAALRLKREYGNVQMLMGNVADGCGEFAPYDVIICNKPFNVFPRPVVEQLASGGRLIFPLRTESSEYITLVKLNDDGVTVDKLLKLDYISLAKAREQITEGEGEAPDKKKKRKNLNSPRGESPQGLEE